MLLKLAARNLARNLRRTLITVTAIGFGLGLMVWVVNLQNWQHNDLITQAIGTLAGDAVVQAEGYQDEPEADRVVVDSTAIAQTLTELFPDGTVTTRLRASGVLMSAANTVGVGLQGVDPEPEAVISPLDDKLVEGEWLDDDLRGILVGRLLADKLDVDVGNKLVFMGQTDGEMASRLFRVKGIFRTGGPELDGFVAVANVDAVQELYDARDPASQVAVHLEDHDAAPEAAAAIQAAVDGTGLEILPWREAIPQIVGFVELDKKSNDVIWFIIGIMVAAGVLNTVLMSVLERTRELGVMISVGMRPRELAKMVALEGLLLGLIGAAAGLALGALFTWPTATYGLDFSSQMGEGMETVGVTVETVFYATWNWPRVGAYLVAGVLFTVLASAWPAWRVSRLRPVDAMRHT